MYGVRSWGRRWMITDQSKNSNMTHLLLDGGKLSVPYDDEKAFLTKLASDISRGIKNYIVELRTPVYKFNADIDVFEETPKKYEDIKAWICEILSVLREFYQDWSESKCSKGAENEHHKYLLNDTIKVDKLTVIVCTTDVKLNTQKYGKTYSKVGIHLIFPWLKVDTDSALKLRAGFIQHFYKKYGPRPVGTNEWEDVFDHTVYTQNGLRMVGCSKIDRCNKCKPPFKFTPGKVNKCPINKCNGWGKIDVGRIYKITDVISGDGTDNKDALIELQNDELLATRTTSIRLLSEKEPHPQDIPGWYNLDDIIKLTNSNQLTLKTLIPTRTNISTLGVKQLNLDTNQSKARIKSEDNRRDMIEKWFRDDTYLDWYLIPDVYRDISIDDVILNIPCVGDRYYTIRTTARYCQNIEREHSSNGIYFILNRKGLYQKCFCRCNTIEGRVSGKKCAEYHSPRIQIPDKLLSMLFPYSDEIKASMNTFLLEGGRKYIGMTEKDKIMDRLRQFNKPKKH